MYANKFINEIDSIILTKKLPLDRAWFNVLVPYPGTEIFDLYAQGKLFDEIDWAGADATTGMIAKGIKYEDLNSKDMVYWQRRALKEFYLSSPGRIFSVLRNMSPGSIKTLMKTSFFKHWAKHDNE